LAKGMSLRRGVLTGVSSNVLVLGLVSLLNDMSSEMIYPILPLFLAGLGATGTIIGLIEGASETTASLLKVVSGRMSDRCGKRKPFLNVGYGLSMITKPVLSFATSYWQVLGIRITERIGKGLRNAPRDALIADSTEKDKMGKAFGLHKSMDMTGAVIGPLLILPVLLLASTVTEGTYRLVFLLSTIPAIISIVILVLFVKDTDRCHARPTHSMLRDSKRLGRDFWCLTAVVLVFFVGEISYAFFVLRSDGLGLSTITTILLYVLSNLVFVIVSIPSGALSDRLGRKPILAFSFLLFALTCLVMALADNLLFMALGFVLLGVFEGSSEGVFKASVVDMVPDDLRGTALGVYHTAVGIVMLPGSVIAGLLWDGVGPWSTFAYGIVMSIVALSLMLFLTRRK
jgi:MFS family permease